MRHRSEHIFLLIERTVPVLLAIGAVLSVLLLLNQGSKGLLWGAVSVWSLALLCAVADIVFSLLFKKKSKTGPEDLRAESDLDGVLSEVAHELKTPLTVIRGSVEVLLDGAVPAERYPEYYARILRETDAMTKLVSDLLDATRSEEKFRFDPQKTDLSALLKAVCDDMRDVASSRGVVLQWDPRATLPTLSLDPDRMGQLAVILLDNALKHTPEGGTVTLFLDRKGKTALFGVKDNGAGIAPEDLPHVFDRYYKAPVHRGGLAGGTGIGLFVAQKIARLHGGSVDVESKPGKGACFTVRIPLP